MAPPRLRSVRDLDVNGKRVLLRVDFNVPLDKQGRIADDTRIWAALPTIQHLLQRGAAVILCTHLGRPDGRVVEELRVKPVAERLAQLLQRPVEYVPECVGPEVEAAVAKLRPGQVLMLENLRFHPEEERNDPAFARALASLADLYVNDAFGAAHRAHASVVGVTAYLPSAAGLLMEEEVTALAQLLEEPERPFTVVLGGAKVSDKAGVVRHLLQRVDVLLVGGGMACTFLAAQSYEMGRSLVEEGSLDLARELIDEARRRGISLLLPSDAVITNEIVPNAQHRVVAIGEIPPEARMVDIGPETVRQFGELLQRSRTVFWNGPMGVFEVPPFDRGTAAIAEIIAGLPVMTVVGGGETAEAVQKMGLVRRFTHVSTGGGASLEFLEGRTLPGVAPLLLQRT